MEEKRNALLTVDTIFFLKTNMLKVLLSEFSLLCLLHSDQMVSKLLHLAVNNKYKIVGNGVKNVFKPGQVQQEVKKVPRNFSKVKVRVFCQNGIQLKAEVRSQRSMSKI